MKLFIRLGLFAVVGVIVIVFVNSFFKDMSTGFHKDTDRLLSGNMSGVHINSEDPMRGILSSTGVLSNTGEVVVQYEEKMSGMITGTIVVSLILLGVMVVTVLFLFNGMARRNKYKNVRYYGDQRYKY